MSESNRVQLRYVSESTYGTTPTNSSNWKALEFTEESLSAEQDKRQSALVDNNRVIQDKIEVRRTIGGSVGFELRAGWYDDFILAALCGDAWNTDVATLGTTDYSFSVEKEFGDLASGNRFFLYDGIRVGGMSLSVTHGEIVTGTFSLAGQSIALAASSAVGTGSEASQSTSKRIISAAAGFGSFQVDGTSNDADIMSLTFDLVNNHEPTWALGSINANNQVKGDGVVTGTVTAYMDTTTLALYERALNNTDTQLTFRLTDAATSDYYEFDLPKTIITAVSPRSGGRNQRVMVDLNYEAITTAMTITRSIS